MNVHRNVAAIVPAAGSGVRMGGSPKQYRLLGGEPLLVKTLRVFDRDDAVASLVVAVPPDDIESVREALAHAALRKPITIVAGGATRMESVGRALASVGESTEIVLVHDAARPFVTSAQIRNVIDAAASAGAASLAIPVSDTLRRETDGHFGALVDRERLRRVQTPQGFHRALLEQAHDRGRSRGIEATDDASLVMALGHEVHIVNGSSLNVKITTLEDWEMATLCWEAWAHRMEGGEQ